MAAITITSLVLLVYVYVGYPFLCLLAGLLRRRSVRIAACTPRVSVLISAYDEVGYIGATVRNKLDQAYPPELLEIIVVSDGSTDGTDEVVAGIAAEYPGRVRLIRQEPRAGKTSALNMARRQATGEILVFSDANSLYGPGALSALVESFADPEVGYVTGRMVYRAPDGSLTGEGCSAYMAYENRLRILETECGSVVGVAGGVDAVRASCYVEMRADQQPDFVLPLTVVSQGFRVVHEPRALVYEDTLAHADDEFRMRVRVILRAWRALRDMSGLLLPWRSGMFALQLFSHKVLRYLAPVFQLSLLLSNAAMWNRGGAWDVLMILQGLFYLGALGGYLARSRSLPSLLIFPYYLCLLNSAAGVALFRFLRGDRLVTWQPRT